MKGSDGALNGRGDTGGAFNGLGRALNGRGDMVELLMGVAEL